MARMKDLLSEFGLDRAKNFIKPFFAYRDKLMEEEKPITDCRRDS
jgi:hypothetical protein